MGVQFYKDDNGKYRWCTVDGEGLDDVHVSHCGFSRQLEAAQNLFTNHAMMSIFIGAVARGEEEVGGEASGLSFEIKDGKTIWVIRHNDELIGMSYFVFDDKYSAMDNLIILYTTLSVFVASMAQKRSIGL